MKMIKIVLIDYSPANQVMVKQWLKSISYCEVIAVMSSANEFMARMDYRQFEFDLLIIDYFLPLMNGLELISILPAPIKPKCLLVCSSYPDSINLLKQIGAGGFANKCRAQLIKAVKAIALGTVYYDTAYFEAHVKNKKGRQKEVQPKLPARDLEIINLLSCGLSYTQIADQMKYLSARSIETYVHQFKKKHDLNSNPQLIKWAMVKGLITEFDDLPG